MRLFAGTKYDQPAKCDRLQNAGDSEKCYGNVTRFHFNLRGIERMKADSEERI